MNIQYLLLSFILVNTIIYYSKQNLFYIPIIKLFFASSLQIADMYLKILQPNIKELIIKTGNELLYVLGANSIVRLINQLSSINNDNIIQVSGGLNKLNSLVLSNTSDILFLLYTSTAHTQKGVMRFASGVNRLQGLLRLIN